MKKNMGRVASLLMVSALLIAGCSPLRLKKSGGTLFGGERFAEENESLTERLSWVPLGLSKDSYEAALSRVKKYVKVGMTRKDFLEKMSLLPLDGLEWNDRITAGEGWFSELSRSNRVGDVKYEEFSFGYFEKTRLSERFAVVLKNNRVIRISHSPWRRGRNAISLPAYLMESSKDAKEEDKKIATFYQKKLLTLAAFRKVLPHLKRIRPGWTGAEVRLALGGSLYRFPSGLVYFQRGLLWNHGFRVIGTGPDAVVIMPFGYLDEKKKVHTRVVIRVEGGVVTSLFWRPE